MTATCSNGSHQTCGYLMCRHRRYGCEEHWVYHTFADEPQVQAERDAHELDCIYRPPPLRGI